MKQITLKMNCASAMVIAGLLAVAPAIADKPSWAGDKGGKGEHREKSNNKGKQGDGDGRSSRDNAVRTSGHFGDRHRTSALAYYNEEFRGGRCPPGLAKKNNGCMPPGQAKKWTVGRPLPRDVIYYDVPPTLVVQFGPPPTGHRYVRVAGDILLLAVGTGMVIDAIHNLGRN